MEDSLVVLMISLPHLSAINAMKYNNIIFYDTNKMFFLHFITQVNPKIFPKKEGRLEINFNYPSSTPSNINLKHESNL